VYHNYFQTLYPSKRHDGTPWLSKDEYFTDWQADQSYATWSQRTPYASDNIF
jgi:hypothetical protein